MILHRFCKEEEQNVFDFIFRKYEQFTLDCVFSNVQENDYQRRELELDLLISLVYFSVIPAGGMYSSVYFP